MNREIKFRVYDIVEKEMFQWNEIKNFHYFLHFEQFILLQYTGMKDVHGNEIYEGDVLCASNSKRKEEYTVIFSNGCFKLKSNKHERLTPAMGVVQKQMLKRPFEPEIIKCNICGDELVNQVNSTIKNCVNCGFDTK